MIFTPLPLAGACLVDLETREDERGFFARLFCAEEFTNQGLETRWVQMNTSLSRHKGTLRGLHFQRPPKAEVKVVRCLRGAIWDVLVDLREGSETFGAWFGTELTDANRRMVYIPQGFAHGFQTLEHDTELLYLHSEFYSPEHEGGLRYDDPAVAIEWPLAVADMSPRDQGHPSLAQLKPIAP